MMDFKKMRAASRKQWLSPTERALAMILGATAAASVWTPAVAQEDAAPSYTLDEVVVTAERREGNNQTTAIAVTGFSAESLEEKAVVNLVEVQNYTPGLTIFSGRGAGSDAAFVFIRGIGQYDLNPSTDPGVGIYVDDVYLGRVQGGLFDLDDVASVEVLRGPQGTLYGKNTMGGAVIVRSRLPGQEPYYYGNLIVGSEEYVKVTASVSGPLIDDKLFGGLTFGHASNGGFLENRYDGENLNVTDKQTIRGTLRFTPNEWLEGVLTVDGSRDRSSIQQARLEAIDPNAPLYSLLELVGPLEDYIVGSDPWTPGYFNGPTDPNLPPKPYNDSWGASLRLTGDFDGLTVRSITALREQEGISKHDDDGSPLLVLEEANDISMRQFSQEVHVAGSALDDRLEWLVGAFYLQEDLSYDTYALFAPEFGPGFSSLRTAEWDTQSRAVFGQATFSITEALKVTAGLRYTQEDKEIRVVNRDLFDLDDIMFGPAGRSASFEDTSPKIGISYQATPTIFTYASASKGFKSGGFNGRAGVGAALDPFQPEIAWTYEGGVKTTWLENRLRLNAALYYTDYKDIQLTVTTVKDGEFFQTVDNAGAGHIQGIEIEGEARPMQGLTLFASLSLMKAEYDEYLDAALGDVSDREFVNAPESNYTVGGRYEFEVAPDMLGAVSADYSYRGKSYFDPQNTEVIAENGYGLLNGRASLTLERSNVELAVFGKNLTDEVYRTTGFGVMDSFGWAIAWYGQPRTFGFQISIRR